MADEIVQFPTPDDEEANKERIRQRWLNSGLGAARLTEIMYDMDGTFDPELILLDHLEDFGLLPAFDNYLNEFVEGV